MIRVEYLVMGSNIPSSLAEFVKHLASVAPGLAQYLPRHNGEVTFRPVRKDNTQPGYDEDWISPRVNIPLAALEIQSSGRLCMEMHWHGPRQRHLRESTDETPVTVPDPAMAELLMWVEHAPGVTIDDLPALISGYSQGRGRSSYVPEQALRNRGAPSRIDNVPTDSGGMRHFPAPGMPQRIYG